MRDTTSIHDLIHADEQLDAKMRIHDIAAREDEARAAAVAAQPSSPLVAALQQLWDAAAKAPPRELTPSIQGTEAPLPPGSMSSEEAVQRVQAGIDAGWARYRAEEAERKANSLLPPPGALDQEFAAAKSMLSERVAALTMLQREREPLAIAHRVAANATAECSRLFDELRATRAAALEARARDGSTAVVEPTVEQIGIVQRRLELLAEAETRALEPVSASDWQIRRASCSIRDAEFHLAALTLRAAAAEEVARLRSSLSPLLENLRTAAEDDPELQYSPVAGTGLRQLRRLCNVILRSMDPLLMDADVRRAIGRG